MSSPQPGVLAPVAAAGRALSLDLAPGAAPSAALAALAELTLDEGLVVGLGSPLAAAVPGLRAFPVVTGPGVAFPSTQGAAWVFVRGDDAGAVLLRARAVAAALAPALTVTSDIGTFRYAEGRDLTGYEDGTENPRGDAASAVAFSSSGASFVAVQQWVHDLARFGAMSPAARDRAVGRARESNDELDDAPESAHVKRTAQERFAPPAFMVRRSMPFGDLVAQGLYFVAYGATLDAFERALRRMSGADDGVVDALLTFSRAVTGGYYWCPPLREGRLDLGLLGA